MRNHYVVILEYSLFPTEEQEFAYTMGKKDTPVKLDTRLMYFDLLKLRQDL